ncbi:hypothetical protein LEP1GSC088_3936 [Leptospira interrogans str. L1207]|nr:hypothetical protein LEP1GSC088_3936 [Leptospira interrogans str. L1207]
MINSHKIILPKRQIEYVFFSIINKNGTASNVSKLLNLKPWTPTFDLRSKR